MKILFHELHSIMMRIIAFKANLMTKFLKGR